MDSTDTWVIVLAAFSGGLAGAVLQPLLSYVFERLRAGETIRKGRQRNIRRMVFDYIRFTRRVQGSVLSGKAPGMEGLPFWEPERIDDATLHDLVVGYNEKSAELFGVGSPLPGKNVDQGRVKQLDGDLNDLQRRITARMDTLNYPEIDS